MCVSTSDEIFQALKCVVKMSSRQLVGKSVSADCARGALLNGLGKWCLEIRERGQVARETRPSQPGGPRPWPRPHGRHVTCLSPYRQLSGPQGVSFSGGQDGGLNFWQAVQGPRKNTRLWIRRAKFKSSCDLRSATKSPAGHCPHL